LSTDPFTRTIKAKKPVKGGGFFAPKFVEYEDT